MAFHNINTIYLNDAFDPKSNNFGFLRFALASLVVFSHCHPLGGFASAKLFGSPQAQEDYGSFAVTSFFILSGFLITRSYTTTSSVWRFLWHRILRIFPGYWVCLLVTVLIFAPLIYLFENGHLNGYFQTQIQNPLTYLSANFLLDIKQSGIGNLFVKDVPYPIFFNVSLWTLVYEFKFYLFVAILGVVGIFNFYKKIVLYLFLFLCLMFVFDLAVPGIASKIIPYFSDIYLLKLLIYFLAGCLYFLYKEKIVFNNRFFVLSVILIVVSINDKSYNLVAPFTLPYILFWLAFKLPFRNFDKYGDFSYGLYIYSSPVEQMLAFFGLHKRGFIVYFLLSILVAIILSVLSYEFIEKPALKLKKLRFKDIIKILNSFKKFIMNKLKFFM
ncbi:acyltransferase family protein [Nostoc sp.]|uniref:acyltransferase family protein n=1 Tax=Nostoc sp. TaxID=1180 RepID=UPI002FF9A1F1